MDTMKLMTGVDIPLPFLHTVMHQPSIKEISYVGETQYFLVMQLFGMDKNVLIANNPKGASGLSAMSNFQIFMTLIREPEMIKRQPDILAVLTLLFPEYTPQFLPRSIFFNHKTEEINFTIDENTYDAFRDAVSVISGLNSSVSGSNGGFNPRGKKAAEIAAKLMRGRQRASKNQGGKGSSGVLSRYISILTVALPSMSLNDCLNLTVFQLYDLMERYSLHLNWDIDLRSRLAGGKPDKEPDDWMKDIH